MDSKASAAFNEERRHLEMFYLRHRREAYPVPADCTIDLLPDNMLNLKPGEEQMVTVKVSTDRPFVDKQAININAFVESNLIGGVTLYVHS